MIQQDYPKKQYNIWVKSTWTTPPAIESGECEIDSKEGEGFMSVSLHSSSSSSLVFDYVSDKWLGFGIELIGLGKPARAPTVAN